MKAHLMGTLSDYWGSARQQPTGTVLTEMTYYLPRDKHYLIGGTVLTNK
jgi:hypothetical protein